MLLSCTQVADAATDIDFFTVRVVDRQTGGGVPLVELHQVNNIRCFTDSNGSVVFPHLARDLFDVRAAS